MRNILLKVSLCIGCLLTLSCSKEKPENQPPSIVELIYPKDGLLCINNTIPFNWSDAVDPENDDLVYTIVVAKDRQLMNVVKNINANTSQTEIILEKSTAFYWQVVAVDAANNLFSTSKTFAFFTKGDGATNYAPFMADLKMPENDARVDAGSIDLVWEGTDIDTADTLTYELFFGENDTLNIVDSSLAVQTYTVVVVSGKTYSWKVNVIDSSGAKSIGQVFTFTAV